MTTSWLHALTLPGFRRAQSACQPHAEPSTAASLTHLFDWESVDSILRSERSHDVIVTAAGAQVPLHAPSEAIEVRALLRCGMSVVIRRAEKTSDELSNLAVAVVRRVPGQAHIQLFATPADSHTFGWHYDFEDVFIVQTVGSKDYFFRENTVDLKLLNTAPPDFSRIAHETTPLMTARLVAGDWLYLPRRWWHAAKCRENSLSISIGVALNPAASSGAPCP